MAGANKKDTHIRNVNYPRDFKADTIADISTVGADDSCVKCKGKLQFKNGIEVGHVFKLGIFLSERFGVTYLDKEGASKPAWMGCYGIGVGRLLAAAIEQSHDDKGIIWPMAISPFQLHLCALKLDDKNVFDTAEKIYSDLTAAGFEILYDDRDESAGKKFNDADLIGIPVRLTISPRTLEKGNVEVKMRNEKDARLFPLEGIEAKLQELVKV